MSEAWWWITVDAAACIVVLGLIITAVILKARRWKGWRT